MTAKELRVAILDLYAGVANEGMRCLRELVRDFCTERKLSLRLDEFEVRKKLQIPREDYDVYISSGGPGSPLESEGSRWEKRYFTWIGAMEKRKKHVLFICHSFQLACRYFRIAQVARRKSTAFGVFPVHMVNGGHQEPVFSGLKDPFYAVDSRDYQVIQPDHEKIEAMGGAVLAIEKERPHVPLERSVMAMRFTKYMVGTQFHPEADAEGMSRHLQQQEKRDLVVANHGYEKWQSMIEQLEDPDKIRWTYSHIIPNFLSEVLSTRGKE